MALTPPPLSVIMMLIFLKIACDSHVRAGLVLHVQSSKYFISGCYSHFTDSIIQSNPPVHFTDSIVQSNPPVHFIDSIVQSNPPVHFTDSIVQSILLTQ